MIIVSTNTEKRQCIPNKGLLGFEEDNNSNKIVFKFEDGFVDGIARLYIKKGDKKGNIELEKEGDTYVLPVKRSLFIGTGIMEFQLTIYSGEDIVASYSKFYLEAKEKIVTDEEIPEELPSWIDDYNAKIIMIETAIEDTEKAIENANNVASELLEAKENGEFKGEKGDKGDKGDAGSVKFIVVTELPIENIDESAIYMKLITESEEQNKYEEFIYVNGEWESLGIAQVEVNLDDYVKNTDYATSTKVGVVKAPVWGGLATVDGSIFIDQATDAQIIAKLEPYKPLTTTKIDLATKVGITTNTIALTEQEQVNACNWLGTGRMVVLTQAEYDALEIKDENTYYNIVEG